MAFNGTRGFGNMAPELQRAIASQGGKAAHAMKRGHEWTSAEAAEAGRKGGRRSWHRRQQQTQNHKEPTSGNQE